MDRELGLVLVIQASNFKGLDFGAGARGQGMIGEEGEVCSCLGPRPR